MAERECVEYEPESLGIAILKGLSYLRYPHRYPQMVAVTPPFSAAMAISDLIISSKVGFWAYQPSDWGTPSVTS